MAAALAVGVVTMPARRSPDGRTWAAQAVGVARGVVQPGGVVHLPDVQLANGAVTWTDELQAPFTCSQATCTPCMCALILYL